MDKGMPPLEGAAWLTKQQAKLTPPTQPASSNTGPLDAWRRVVDAAASEKRGGAATAAPFHPTGPGQVSAHDAWKRAIAKA